MTTLDEALDEWIARPSAGRFDAHARTLGPAAWARARIERLLDPRPLPGDAWIFVPTLMELAPYASAEERVRLLHRAAVPPHDASMRWLEPLDGELLAAAEAHARPLTGQRLDDLRPVIVALAAVVARGRAGLPHDPRWEPYLARDFSLYDRFDFGLTREALGAVPADRRAALVRAAVARGEPMALQALDLASPDASLFDAAFDLALRTTPAPDHLASPAHGLARCGASATPWLLARLTRDGATAAEASLALQALTEVRDPAAAEAMVAATGRSSVAVSAAATKALAALHEAARPAVTAGARSRKRAVREACEWLLRLLDGDDAAPLRAVRDAHAALDEAARRQIADALRDRWMGLDLALTQHGAAVTVEAIDRWGESDPQLDLPGYLARLDAPSVTWALAWVATTRAMHRRHLGCVHGALQRRGDRAAAEALLGARPGVQTV